MFKRTRLWLWSHRKRTIALILLLGFLLLNVITFNHAYTMTHFTTGGQRTKRPEAQSVLEKLQTVVMGVNIPRPENGADPASVGLPFTTHCFPGNETNITLEAWYVPHPQAQGLVLLFHGYAGCKAKLLQEARAFHDLGYATLLVDFRGCGGSTGNETTIGVYEADDVAQAMAYAQKLTPNQPLILYGRSMGSAAILRAVALHDIKPSAVVLESSFDRLLATAGNRFNAMGLPAFPCAELLVFWGGVEHQFNGFAHNPVDYARSVSCSALILQGDQDPRVKREQAEAILANLAGKKHLELFAGVGHEPCLASRPEQWRRTVADFLTGAGSVR